MESFINENHPINFADMERWNAKSLLTQFHIAKEIDGWFARGMRALSFYLWYVPLAILLHWFTDHRYLKNSSAVVVSFTRTKKTNHQKDLWFDNTFYEFFSWWNPCPFHMRVIRYVWWSWARMHLASLYAAAANIVAVSPRPADVSSYTVSL